MIPATSDQGMFGIFEAHRDVGPVRTRGSAAYHPEAQAYTITGCGAGMGGEHDRFHLVWKRMRGDFLLRARAAFIDPGTDPHRQLGWTVRSTLEPTAPHASAVVTGGGLATLQLRRTAGAETQPCGAPLPGADVIQLERKGGRFILSAARFGDPLTSGQPAFLPLADEVYVGLFACAPAGGAAAGARFRDVRIVVPASEGFVPYRDYLGANLEILDVRSGDRTIVYRSPEALQAPNWTPDGTALLYNSGGRMYRFELATRRVEVLDTGFAVHNNNDHVLSFDGTRLGISHHSSEDDGRSIIYVLPAKGGEPRRITARGPSYLHGWSPDGRLLLYTGERDGKFDIYRISVEGGEETRLTSSEGVNDGPEYAPDGRCIYFNSSRGGRMQIWRMKPDGSDQERITDDRFNNWFPHPSPDGRWIVFLSYGPEVEPEDHPWYKRVYLRRMPAAGGAPEVVAYVYGGQGTLNVPSWSPDSRYVAFVSNTG